MKKKLLIAVAVMAVLAVGATLVVPALVDTERVRNLATAEIGKALGRAVKIEKVRFSFYPPSAQLEGLEVGDDPAFSKKAFATAKELQVGLEIMPLIFEQRAEITGITARAPEIALRKNAAGKWNYETLGGPAAPVSGKTPAAAAAATPVEIGALRIREGVIILEDARSPGRPSRFENVDMTLSNIQAGKAIDFTAAMKYGGGVVEAEGQAGPLNPAKPKEVPAHGKLVFKDLDLAAIRTAMEMPGLAGTSNGEVTFDSKGNTIPVEGKLRIDRFRLDPQGGPATAPVEARFKVDYAQPSGRIAIREFAISSGQSTVNIGGQLSTTNPAGSELTLRAKDARLVDVGKVLPAFAVKLPPGGSLAAGTLTTNTRLRGPFKTLNGDTTVEILNGKLAGYSFSNQIALVGKLAGVPQSPDTQIDSLRSAMVFSGGATQVNTLDMVMPAMTITGTGNVGAAGDLHLKMTATLTSTQATAVGILQKVTGGQNTLPFNLTGTFAAPVIIPDVGRLAQQQILQRKDTVDKILGGFFKKKQ